MIFYIGNIIYYILNILFSMKPLTERTIFEQVPTGFLMEKQGCLHFQNKKPEQRHLTMFPPRPENALLWCESIWEERFGKECHMRRVNSNFLALEHIRQGSLYVRQNNTMFLAEKDDFFLLRPDGDLEFLTGPHGFCLKHSLILSGPLLDDILRHTGLDGKNYLPYVNVKKFESLLHLFKSRAQEYRKGILQELEQHTYELILLLKNLPQETVPDTLSELTAFMETNLHQPFVLRELAKHYGCSVSHLTHLFHIHFQTTPYRMLMQMRMRRAASLLLETDFSIKEIASKIGYDNALNFSTEFKKKHHVSPREFRKKTLSQ